MANVLSHPLVRRVTRHQKMRFALVGVVNTAVDFSVLFGLVTLFHVPALVANIVSTSAALAVSYLLNKRAVFRDSGAHDRRQIVLFVIVTLSGLWILQGLTISATRSLLWMITGIDNTFMLLPAKIVATVVSLVWNYTWYSRVVFPGSDKTAK